jgi:hypothetical protein
MAPEKTWVGVDVSQASLDVYLLPQGKTLQVSNTEAGVQELLSQLQLTPPHLVVAESALHNRAMKSGEKRCSVQSVAPLISVKMGSRKVNKITFAKSAGGSSLTPILRLLDTQTSLSVSVSKCTSMAQDFERLNGSKGFIIQQ